MPHKRTLIRQAAVASLIGANTDAGTRVDDTRVDPNVPTDLPAISVYTGHEDVTEGSDETAPREVSRELELVIRAWVPHSSLVPVQVAMDNIADQIEAVLDDNWLLSGHAVDSILASTDIEVVEGGKSDPLVGIVSLTYTVTYRTYPREERPGPTDEFRTANVEHRPLGTDQTNEATDTIDVRGSLP